MFADRRAPWRSLTRRRQALHDVALDRSRQEGTPDQVQRRRLGTVPGQQRQVAGGTAVPMVAGQNKTFSASQGSRASIDVYVIRIYPGKAVRLPLEGGSE